MLSKRRVKSPLKVLAGQDLHRLEKYLKMKGHLEKSLKMNFVLKST